MSDSMVSISEVVRANHIDYLTLLAGSPYSLRFNWDGELSEDIFYKTMFQDLVFYPQMTKVLRNCTIDYRTFKPLIFIYGYKGTGKTTFIHNFIRNNLDSRLHRYHFFDFDLELTDDSRILVEVMVDEITATLNSDELKYREYVLWLADNIAYLSPGLSRKTIKELAGLFLPEKVSSDFNGKMKVAFEEFLSTLEFQDLAMILLLFYLSMKEDVNHLILFFDNLDSIEIQYLNSSFAKEVWSLEARLKRIKQNKKLALKNKAMKSNLIFIMRDANCSLVNLHFKNQDEMQYKIIGFSVSTEDETILKKRIDLVDDLVNKRVVESDYHEAMKDIRDDLYTQKTFLQMFNFDHREFIYFINKLSEDSINSVDLDDNPLENYLSIKRLGITEKNLINMQKYGARGIIFFKLIDYLFESEFLHNYKVLTDKFKQRYNVGFYNPFRFILTVILNLNTFDFSKYTLDANYTPNYERKSASLLDVVRCLYQIYDIGDILTVIEDYFMSYKKSWSNLVTIFGCRANRKNELQKYKDALLNVITAPEEDLESREDLRTLKGIRVKINPAGFIYIRNIIAHFEFFSKRANSRCSLFMATRYLEEKEVYEFEIVLDSVFSKVKKCIDDMSLFYRENFQSHDIDEKEFLRSVYVFKHPINSEYDLDEYLSEPSETGDHYSSRIIENHIGYIESFRNLILHSYEYRRRFEFDKNGIELRDVNRTIVRTIDKYLGLYELFPRNSRIDSLYRNLRYCVATIRRSDFYDFEQVINNRREVIR